MSGWGTTMLIAGGLFAGGAATFAWSRVPIWRKMPAAAFVDDFSQTLRRTDMVQPALLIAAIAGSAGFGATADGSSRTLALVGGVAFLAVLIASVLVLVPLQRRIVKDVDPETIGAMRERWFRGHFGRALLSVAGFATTAVAVSV